LNFEKGRRRNSNIHFVADLQKEEVQLVSLTSSPDPSGRAKAVDHKADV